MALADHLPEGQEPADPAALARDERAVRDALRKFKATPLTIALLQMELDNWATILPEEFQSSLGGAAAALRHAEQAVDRFLSLCEQYLPSEDR